jgi:hypothetical protein
MTSSAVALLRRPDLWPAALRLVPPRWWRRWPPRPWPPAAYRTFRTETMYGAGGRLEAEDLVRYLEWCRAMHRRAR